MKRLLSASILAASLASGAAFAQVGPYAGASVGQSNYSIDCTGNCSKTDFGFKAFGGYMFTPYIGAEVDYGWYGKADVNTYVGTTNVVGQLKSDGFSGFLVGQYPIDNFRIFGKLGFARMTNQVDVHTPSGAAVPTTITNNDASFEFAYGLGGIWMFDKNFGLRGEYEGREIKWEGDKKTLGFWSLGLEYHF
jgi:opacity protein-like surface antigen